MPLLPETQNKNNNRICPIRQLGELNELTHAQYMQIHKIYDWYSTPEVLLSLSFLQSRKWCSYSQRVITSRQYPFLFFLGKWLVHISQSSLHLGVAIDWFLPNGIWEEELCVAVRFGPQKAPTHARPFGLPVPAGWNRGSLVWPWRQYTENEQSTIRWYLCMKKSWVSPPRLSQLQLSLAWSILGCYRRKQKFLLLGAIRSFGLFVALF